MQQGLGGTGVNRQTTQPTGGPMPNPWATTTSNTTTPSLVGMGGSGGGVGGLEGSGGMGTGGAEGGGLNPFAMGTDMARLVNPQQMMEMMQDPMVRPRGLMSDVSYLFVQPMISESKLTPPSFVRFSK